MPANSTDTAIAEATKDTTFLATCFMNLKSKPQVDNVAVAAKLSMSVGGVRNKLRPIIKSMEDAGAVWTIDQPASMNRCSDVAGIGARSKSKETEAQARNGLDRKISTEPKPVTPASGSKVQSKTASSSTKRGHVADDLDIKGEEITEVQTIPSKRTKVNHESIRESQTKITQRVKSNS